MGVVKNLSKQSGCAYSSWHALVADALEPILYVLDFIIIDILKMNAINRCYGFWHENKFDKTYFCCQILSNNGSTTM